MFLTQFSSEPLEPEMDWLYVWSPRYRFFHECLYATIKDISGIHVKPIFAEQHLFTPVQTSCSHFFAGIAIKIYVIRNYIEKNMGKHFFFTDVDLVVLPEFEAADLEQYNERMPSYHDLQYWLYAHSLLSQNPCLL